MYCRGHWCPQRDFILRAMFKLMCVESCHTYLSALSRAVVLLTLILRT